MAYTPPAGSQVDFSLATDYTAPDDQAADFNLGTALTGNPGAAEGDLSATTADSVATIAGTAGETPAGDLAGATADAIASISASTFLEYGADLLATTDDSQLSATADHGIAGDLLATTDDATAAGSTDHGTSADQTATTTAAAIGTADHGIAGDLLATTGDSVATVVAISSIFSLSGSVKDETGAALARKIRAYDRGTGALIGEQGSDDAQGGYWDMVCVGFSEAECYIVAIDLDPAASDFTPSITNRVMSVLRYD